MKLSKKRILFCILCLLLIVIIILLGYRLAKRKTFMSFEFEDRIQTLAEFNSGEYYKVGWLQVQGTNIDFPILDSRAGSQDFEYSFGWRSPMYTTGENREVLLGHNILNVSSTPMLSNDNLNDFEALMSFSYAGFASDNLYIQYTKDGKNEIYLIYAVGFYDYGFDNAESMKDADQVKDYIKTVRKNSIYDYDIEVDERDELLTIKTCTRYFGLEEKQQFVIDARKLRKEEKFLKYSVVTNHNFEKLIGSKENG